MFRDISGSPAARNQPGIHSAVRRADRKSAVQNWTALATGILNRIRFIHQEGSEPDYYHPN
jgi:hypothetical protein